MGCADPLGAMELHEGEGNANSQMEGRRCSKLAPLRALFAYLRLKLLSTRHCTSLSALLTQRESSRTGKQLLRVVSAFAVIVSLGGWRVGQGALGMGLRNQGGGGQKEFGNHCSIRRHYATSRKVAGSRPYEVPEFLQYT
jgi:hypothetical protein